MPETPKRYKQKSTMQTRHDLEKCWEYDMKWHLVPEKLREGCFRTGKALSLPPLSILCGLMVLTSYAMSHAAVHVEGTDWYEPVILWLVMTMPSGCGKSTLYKFLRRVVEQTRSSLELTDESPAWSAEEATMERLGALMCENKFKMLGLYDELTHFLTQMNIYKGKTLTDSQDLAMLLQLHNGLSWTRKTVSRECNFSMPLTSFTIGGFTQPSTAEGILCQSGSAEKGFSTRFLWVSPEPVFNKLNELATIDEIFLGDLVSLLVNLVNNGKNYPDSRKVFELKKSECPSFQKKFDEIQDNLKSVAGYDDMITGMISKSKGQILRVAGIFTVLFNITEEDTIPNEINDVALTAAIEFVSLCCDHAFFIASRLSLKDEIKSVLEEGRRDDSTEQEQPKQKNLRAHTLLLPGKKLHVTPLLKKKKWRGLADRDTVIKTLEDLEEHGMGSLQCDKGTGTHKKYTFIKTAIPLDEEEKCAFTMKLTEIGVSLRQYSESLMAPDITDDSSGKRPISEPTRSSPRKSPRKNQ